MTDIFSLFINICIHTCVMGNQVSAMGIFVDFDTKD